jgi:EF hand
MKNVIMAATLAALVGGGVAPALAQTATPPQGDAPQMMEQGHHGKGRHGHGGPGGRDGVIDANFDDVVGDDEAARIAERDFNRIDADRNGTLTQDEFTARRSRGGWLDWVQTQDAAITEVLKVKFAALDADKNASVTKAEFLADAKARYEAADADKDGKVSPWEFRAQN